MFQSRFISLESESGWDLIFSRAIILPRLPEPVDSAALSFEILPIRPKAEHIMELIKVNK